MMEWFEYWLSGESYWLARWLIEHGLAAMYGVAFLVVARQFRPLLGEHGLEPVPKFVRSVSFWQAPSIFHWYYSDRWLQVVGWTGLGLAMALMFGVFDSGPWWLLMLVWFILWVLYLSIVNVGQTFYSFGWESLLLESGFLVMFLGTSGHATGSATYAAPVLVIWLFRWLVFRLEFGAGLIKLRGDQCWRNLTCLMYHYETQPMPNPLSWYIHHLPRWFHRVSVLGNHFVQLIVPFGLFLPQPYAAIAGGLIILSQCWIIIHGNFSWLNYITIILAFSAFGDATLIEIMPGLAGMVPETIMAASWMQQSLVIGLAGLVGLLSIQPILNLVSRRQIMNFSFNPLHLVNTYGAFGSITKKRYEIIIEGTVEAVVTPTTQWLEYEFKGKPGNLQRRPPLKAPYHLRLDWQMWFAAMGPAFYESWIFPLIERLLKNDRLMLTLLANNPFPDAPPRFIRAQLYLYQFTTPAERRATGHWWKRTFVREYIPASSLTE